MSRFEELIKTNERDLTRIRSQYFPLIANEVITGYNLYLTLFDYSQGRLFLNYLHSNLKPGDAHFRELSEKLMDKGFIEERIVVDSEVIDKERIIAREADYLTRADWEDPPNMRYFDFSGREIPAEKAKSSKKELIGETLQYDWLIKLNNEEELRQVIDIFKAYAGKFQLDNYGRKIMIDSDPQHNRKAVSEAWEIPLLVCTSTDNKKPSILIDFLRVNQFNISERLGEVPITLSTLVRAKSKELKNFLQEQSHNINLIKKYALRVFVENYIDM